MIATKYITKYGKHYEIYPFLDSVRQNGDMCRITVTQTDTHGEGFGKAGINWPGCGSQPTEYVEKFSEGIQFAIAIARELNAGREPQDNKIVAESRLDNYNQFVKLIP